MRDFLNWFCVAHLRRVGNPQWLDFLIQFEEHLKSIDSNVEVDSWDCQFNSKIYLMKNFSFFIPGKKNEKIIIGVHYDSCGHTPGADDNGSAVAVLLDIVKLFKNQNVIPEYTLEFVLYCAEEPPFFGTEMMGSFRHAKKCKENKEKVHLMICLEMLGFYSDQPDSQDYPWKPLKFIYGNQGNFLLSLSNLKSFWKVKKLNHKLQSKLSFNLKHICLPIRISGSDWSDHANYWNVGIPAMMLTDTAFFRNKNYHEHSDTVETLDFHKMEQISLGLVHYLKSIS